MRILRQCKRVHLIGCNPLPRCSGSYPCSQPLSTYYKRPTDEAHMTGLLKFEAATFKSSCQKKVFSSWNRFLATPPALLVYWHNCWTYREGKLRPEWQCDWRPRCLQCWHTRRGDDNRHRGFWGHDYRGLSSLTGPKDYILVPLISYIATNLSLVLAKVL